MNYEIVFRRPRFIVSPDKLKLVLRKAMCKTRIGFYLAFSPLFRSLIWCQVTSAGEATKMEL